MTDEQKPPATDEGLVEKLLVAYDEAGKRYDSDCDEHSENVNNPYISQRSAPCWKSYIAAVWEPIIRAHVEEQVAAMVEEFARVVKARSYDNATQCSDARLYMRGTSRWKEP